MTREYSPSDSAALAILADLQSDVPTYIQDVESAGEHADDLRMLFRVRQNSKTAFERTLSALKTRKDSPLAALLLEREAGADTKFHFLEFNDLRKLPKPEWLIYDILPTKGVTFMYGKPKCGKTFVAISMACSVALELADDHDVIGALDREIYKDALNWCGRATRHGHVVYIAAEDIDEVARRALAWADYHQVKDLPNLHFFPCSLDLAKDTPRFMDALNTHYPGVKIRLIVVDTLAMCSLGIEENSKREFDAVFRSLEALWRAYSCCVLTVHHAGKNGTMRGTSSMDGIAYGMIEVSEADENILLKSAGSRRGAGFGDIFLNRTIVETGELDETGQPATTCVVTRSDRQAEENASQLTKFQRDILECLQALGRIDVPRTELINACKIDQKRTRTFTNAVNALMRKGLISMKKEKNRTFYSTAYEQAS